MTIADNTPILVAAELETVGTNLNNQAATISDELSQLASYLNQLPAIWQGAASDYYQGLQAEWNIAAEGLFGPDGVLGEIATAMNVSWNNYSDAEWSNSQTWQHAGGPSAR
ncbi:MAG TPA: WXG100 family type VII secretion target [Streptosporangiaceae bacterium]|jgi:WXG100 family type VII secretion target|nr:WXG100 family type VII secretion target [Streptosporangiaceae bacterium]